MTPPAGRPDGGPPPLAHLVDPPPGRAYLDNAAEGLPIRTADAALLRALELKRSGSRGREGLFAAELACRRSAAAMIGAVADEVALVPDTSTGIARFVDAWPWRSGDEVLINDLEFPSNVNPWLVARDRYGVTVRVLPSRGGVLEPDTLAAALRDETRVVAISQVSFASGGRADLVRMAALTRAAGALLVVDATQGLGAVPLPGDAWDVVFASSYKWLLGVHGVAIMGLRRSVLDRVAAGAPGWRSTTPTFAPDRFERVRWTPDATRFQAGMPAFGPIMVLGAAMTALAQARPERIEAHVLDLGEHLLAGLERMGIEPLTPRARERRAGIVSFPVADPESVRDALAREGVDVWGKDGRLRISFHGHTAYGDVDRCLAALAGAWRQPGIERTVRA